MKISASALIYLLGTSMVVNGQEDVLSYLPTPGACSGDASTSCTNPSNFATCFGDADGPIRLTGIRFWLSTYVSGDLFAEVWSGDDTAGPDTRVLQELVSNPAQGENVHTLQTPLVINAGDSICLALFSDAMGFTFSINTFGVTGSSWTSCSYNSFTFERQGQNFCLEGLVERLPLPSASPSASVQPSTKPSTTADPTASPSNDPTGTPTTIPTATPSKVPTNKPSVFPTQVPSDFPSNVPSKMKLEEDTKKISKTTKGKKTKKSGKGKDFRKKERS